MVGLDVSQGPVTFAETVHYAGFTTAHNIFIHEETGYAYVVGSNMCQSGLYIVDIKNPLSPTFEACFSEDGYVHDVQCKSAILALNERSIRMFLTQSFLSRCHL